MQTSDIIKGLGENFKFVVSTHTRVTRLHNVHT